MAKLTAKQEMFVQEYLIDLNATQAAIRELKERIYNPSLRLDKDTQFTYVVSALAVLVSKDIKDYVRKKACLLILKAILPNWKGIFNNDCAPINRHDTRVSAWKNKVLQRDKFHCIECGSVDNLEVHHIIPWADYPDGRIDVNNGVTLCNKCHSQQHIEVKQLVLNRAGKRC